MKKSQQMALGLKNVSTIYLNRASFDSVIDERDQLTSQLVEAKQKQLELLDQVGGMRETRPEMEDYEALKTAKTALESKFVEVRALINTFKKWDLLQITQTSPIQNYGENCEVMGYCIAGNEREQSKISHFPRRILSSLSVSALSKIMLTRFTSFQT